MDIVEKYIGEAKTMISASSIFSLIFPQSSSFIEQWPMRLHRRHPRQYFKLMLCAVISSADAAKSFVPLRKCCNRIEVFPFFRILPFKANTFFIILSFRGFNEKYHKPYFMKILQMKYL